MRVVDAFGLVINENSLKVISLTLKLFKELFDNGISTGSGIGSSGIGSSGIGSSGIGSSGIGSSGISSSGISSSGTCTSKRKSDGKEDNIQENKKKRV